MPDSTPSRGRPRAFTLSHSAFGSFGTFMSTARSGPLAAPTLRSRCRLFVLQFFANAASAGFLILIVVWALGSRGLDAAVARVLGKGRADRRKREWDDHRTYENEHVVKEIQYYARNCGFNVIEQEVETKDGYLLKVFKVTKIGREYKARLHSDGRGGFPVLIQHGLFQSCGSFVTSEERSLAFWLVEHGDYQVYLGNNRGVFDMGHVKLDRGDPRFWGEFSCIFLIRWLTIFHLTQQTIISKNLLFTTYLRWSITFGGRPDMIRLLSSVTHRGMLPCSALLVSLPQIGLA
jgi:lysosomal acid lipase/cholesteryl ester hydrolase